MSLKPVSKPRSTLTQKQESFCLNYFQSGNATQSAIIAGYSPKTARFMASRWLTKVNVKTRLAELRDKTEDSTKATVEEIDKLMTAILRTTPEDIMELSADGRDLTIKKEALKSPAVAYVRTEQVALGKMPVRISRLGLIDKVRAADQWCKMRKIYSEMPAGYQDNRVMNIIVSSEKAKELIDGVNARLLPEKANSELLTSEG